MRCLTRTFALALSRSSSSSLRSSRTLCAASNRRFLAQPSAPIRRRERGDALVVAGATAERDLARVVLCTTGWTAPVESRGDGVVAEPADLWGARAGSARGRTSEGGAQGGAADLVPAAAGAEVEIREIHLVEAQRAVELVLQARVSACVWAVGWCASATIYYHCRLRSSSHSGTPEQENEEKRGEARTSNPGQIGRSVV